MTKALVLVGPPAAGKSTFATIAEEKGFQVVRMGDYLKEQARKEIGQKIEAAKAGEIEASRSDLISDFATQKREDEGYGVVGEWVVEGLSNPDDVVVIDGLRSPDSLEVFEEEFDEVELVHIHADFESRVQFMRERGRDGEGNNPRQSLRKREENESKWGVEDVYPQASFQIVNDGSEEEFREEVCGVLELI